MDDFEELGEVEAVEYDGTNADEVMQFSAGRVHLMSGALVLPGLDFDETVRVGDFVTKNAAGRVRRYSPENMRSLYREV